MNRIKKKTKVYSITMDETLLGKLDDFCSKQNMSRSGATNLAVRTYLESVKMMPSAMEMMKDFTKLLSELAGMSPDEKRAALDQMESRVNSFQIKTEE